MAARALLGFSPRMAEQRDLQHEFYDMLMESQYWLPETMVTYQRSQPRRLTGGLRRRSCRIAAAAQPRGGLSNVPSDG